MRNLSIFLVIACTLFAALINAGTVYKKVSKDGSVQYSDKPFPGAVELKLKDIDAQNTLPRFIASTSSITKSNKATGNKKAEITIISPIHGDTIRNNQGDLTVLVQKKGAKNKSYKTRVLINDSTVTKPTQSTVIEVKNLDRGEQKIKVQLISSSGKILATSKETVVYLHRVSVIRSK